jgi:hypothetical protein
MIEDPVTDQTVMPRHPLAIGDGRHHHASNHAEHLRSRIRRYPHVAARRRIIGRI